MVHQPVSRGLAVFANAWLSGWLAEISADLRENGSALEVVPRRCAIQIHDFTLFYFKWLLKLTTDSHEASRGLFTTAELLATALTRPACSGCCSWIQQKQTCRITAAAAKHDDHQRVGYKHTA